MRMTRPAGKGSKRVAIRLRWQRPVRGLGFSRSSRHPGFIAGGPPHDCQTWCTADGQARAARGMTIIETIVLMTGVAAMLGLCVLMLQLLMKVDGQSRARLDGAAASAFAADEHDDRHVEQPSRGGCSAMASAMPRSSDSMPG